ncbi:MAG: 30S ribosomal protein S3 [Candidatus Dadabacteria bacterium]|nr:30S ribosomal protein S3 [Candidatus Dadabacteria bacterium]MCZ6528241.1 30S ribosomal protein S3 [Candidatus Dadabacteria bacterium]MCZ6554567.1 30S ribosomal protein S3 [Candidatus Dadabacteria bacterium]MCZ6639844.1 30S ribosomal protein S3 [Candidatus Dadabacteria bacterium]MCZ6685763.1 30S ribosomal protein S3 [Candidatus Dadabacteria bacterium]
MGQKVCPIGLRLGITKTWDSKWFAEKRRYTELLHEDLKIWKLIKTEFYQAAISKIELERAASERVRIIINSARPGMIIGRKGQEIESLRRRLSEMTGKDIYLDIREVKRPEIDAQLVAENTALQLERRVAYRRAMKRVIASALRLGALGIKVMVSGRLGGAEIARKEWYRKGRVPLTTLRADIDYGFAEAKTTYGVIGIKVWIFKGEVLEKKSKQMV